jgi:hypothetical protein
MLSTQRPHAVAGPRCQQHFRPRSGLGTRPWRPLPALRQSSQNAAQRGGWADAATQAYYGVECSSKEGKAKQKAHKQRGRVRSLVAEVESIVVRLESGQLDPLAMPVTSPGSYDLPLGLPMTLPYLLHACSVLQHTAELTGAPSAQPCHTTGSWLLVATAPSNSSG